MSLRALAPLIFVAKQTPKNEVHDCLKGSCFALLLEGIVVNGF